MACYEHLKRIQDKYEDELFRKEGVTGVGIGRKITKGKDTGLLSIRVYVRKKLKDVDKEDMVPKKLKDRTDEVLTDVVEVGEIKALNTSDIDDNIDWHTVMDYNGNEIRIPGNQSSVDRTKRYRPAFGGISMGNIDITAGTFSCVVKATGSMSANSKDETISGNVETGMKYILTNAHVGTSNPTVDVSKQERRNSQPGVADSPNWEDNYIGDLCKFVLIQPDKSNYVDCALIKPYSEDAISEEILDIGVPRGIKDPELNMKVKKSGRTTKLTHGVLQDINVSVNVNYGKFTALFKEQLAFSNMSAGGDSGSLILSEDNYAVALLFAGSSSVTIGNPIKNVLKPLGVDLVTMPDKTIEIDFVLEKENSGWTVKGVVKDTKDNPLENARMTLRDDIGIIKRFTDKEGKYIFENVSNGSKVLFCYKEGYNQKEVAFKIPD